MEVNVIVDTGCTKSVSGKNWFYNFLKCFDNTALNKVKIVPNEKSLKFGDGWSVFSTFQAIVPIRIRSSHCCIQTEIVDEKSPLLLSKATLKKAQTVLNLKEDRLRMFNEDIDICLPSNRHYTVEILPKKGM